jgi:8-oxo-dGTP pyrophosphatase MutT (NUDIX family)
MINPNTFVTYQNKIKKAIDEFLPGEKAQFKMSPIGRSTKGTDHKTKKAGVLLLLYPRDNDIYTVLIKRQIYEGVHSGQISLPGGKMEENDKNITETALRETREEIGIDPNQLHILGKLTTLYIPVSNNLIQPIVGALSDTPQMIPDPREVHAIYEIKLKELLDPSCIVEDEVFIENNKAFNAPFYKVNDLQIWGATAMILSEFVALNEMVKSNPCQ